jgi:predicted ester cyclase
LSPEVIDDDRDRCPSREEYKQAYGTFLSAFHNTEIVVEDLIEEGDRVVSRVVIRGMHKGDLPDLPATGRPFN